MSESTMAAWTPTAKLSSTILANSRQASRRDPGDPAPRIYIQIRFDYARLNSKKVPLPPDFLNVDACQTYAADRGPRPQGICQRPALRGGDDPVGGTEILETALGWVSLDCLAQWALPAKSLECRITPLLRFLPRPSRIAIDQLALAYHDRRPHAVRFPPNFFRPGRGLLVSRTAPAFLTPSESIELSTSLRGMMTRFPGRGMITLVIPTPVAGHLFPKTEIFFQNGHDCIYLPHFKVWKTLTASGTGWFSLR